MRSGGNSRESDELKAIHGRIKSGLASIKKLKATKLLDIGNATRYYSSMIVTFKDKETEKIWNQVYSRKLPMEIQAIALRKLILVHRSLDINDLRIPPGNHLEQLSGSRKGQYSIRINKQWRICFKWEGNNAHNVEITDYH